MGWAIRCEGASSQRSQGRSIWLCAAISYGAGARTIRTDTHRLIAHKNGYAELYDHTSAEKETRNIAEANPDLVERLLKRLEERLARE